MIRTCTKTAPKKTEACKSIDFKEKMERARRFERPTPTLASISRHYSGLSDSTPKPSKAVDLLTVFRTGLRYLALRASGDFRSRGHPVDT